jgi:hypothetical protein
LNCHQPARGWHSLHVPMPRRRAAIDAVATFVRRLATTNPVTSKTFSRAIPHKMLTTSLRKTQHLVVHRFARERDEKGMR